jgi:hypothetical protein
VPGESVGLFGGQIPQLVDVHIAREVRDFFDDVGVAFGEKVE